MSKRISLDEFSDKLSAAAAEFKYQYRVRHEQMPDVYPLQLDACDSHIFYGRFLAFWETGKVV